ERWSVAGPIARDRSSVEMVASFVGSGKDDHTAVNREDLARKTIRPRVISSIVTSAKPLGLWLLPHDSCHHRRIVQVGRPAFYGRVQPGSRGGGHFEVAVDSLDYQTEILGGVAQLEVGRIVTRLDIGPLGPHQWA